MSNSQRASIHYMKNAKRFYGYWSRSGFAECEYEQYHWFHLLMAAAAKNGDITLD